MTIRKGCPAHAQPAGPHGQAAQLAPVTVVGSTGEAIGYVARQSSTATKTDTPIVEVPQSISVITEDQIREQGAQTLNQVLRHTSGIAPETRGTTATRLDQFTVRGFSATTFLDGLRILGSRDALPQIDAYRLQQVDVLKGPSSVMFGQGGPGGVVNQISKRPTADTRRAVELQIGNVDYRRASFDFSGPYDGDAGFEVSDRRRHSVGYDFEHRFNDALTLLSNARYLHAEGIYRSVWVRAARNRRGNCARRTSSWKAPLPTEFPSTRLRYGAAINCRPARLPD